MPSKYHYRIFRDAARRLIRLSEGWGREYHSNPNYGVFDIIRKALPYSTINPFLPEELVTALYNKMHNDPSFRDHYAEYIDRSWFGDFGYRATTQYEFVEQWFAYLGAQSESEVIRFLQELADEFRDPQTEVSVVKTEGPGVENTRLPEPTHLQDMRSIQAT